MDYVLCCGIFGWRKREYISVSVVVEDDFLNFGGNVDGKRK